MNQRPPQIDIDYSDLPNDPEDRHEVFIEIFGQYVCWLRNWTVASTQRLAESEEAREQLGTIRRRKYDRLAELTPEQQAIACEIGQATVDRFIQLLLTMLSGIGVDQRLGSDHAIRFKLDLEICDAETGDVVEQATINRDGRKYFADYWGRWLNHFCTRIQHPSSSSAGERTGESEAASS